MRALLDVNCLLALLDEDHVSHPRALVWWRSNQHIGWATCPLTQNGFVRISAQGGYSGQRPLSVAIEQLSRLMKMPNHEFWPDNISIADDQIFEHGYILGPNQITDVYLLGLAVENGGRLVTFDRGIPVRAVRQAQPQNLVML